MSAHLTVYCETHGEYGPDIRRTAAHRAALVGICPRFHKIVPDRTMPEAIAAGGDEWGEFLNEHEWCRLVLRHE